MTAYNTIIFCIFYSMKPRLLFRWGCQVKAHLNLNVSYPLSKRKQSASERTGTAGLGKNSAKKTGDLLADRALYIEEKIGICPVACEKNSTFLHSSFWERKQKSVLLFPRNYLVLASWVFAELPLYGIRLSWLYNSLGMLPGWQPLFFFQQKG